MVSTESPRTQVTDLTIPKNCQDIVLFVHGFGVRWDSRGMFTDLRSNLPSGWGSVLFDFYLVEDKDVYITSITDQVNRLKSVFQKVQKDHPDATIHLVAHSMGGIIAAISKIKLSGKVLLLAPPTRFGGRMKEYFLNYPGAKLEEESIVVPRKDRTITHIPLEFFEQSKDVDAIREITTYASLQPLHILEATKDEVLKEAAYDQLVDIPGITLNSLPADHNFTNTQRQPLVAYASETLSR